MPGGVVVSPMFILADFFYVGLCSGCGKHLEMTTDVEQAVVSLALPLARDLDLLRARNGFSFPVRGFEDPGRAEAAALELLAWAAEHGVD